MQKGFVTLFSVIILTALVIGLVTVLSAQAILATRNSGDENSSLQARAAATACAELALQNLQQNYAYTGSGSQSLNGGICGYAVTNLGGNNRAVAASSTVSGFVSKLSVTTDASNPAIHISSWQEIQ